MLVRVSSYLAASTMVTALCVVGSPALAADYTHTLSAVDAQDDGGPDTNYTFNLHLEPSFGMELGRATIAREATCLRPDHPSYSDNPLVERRPDSRLVRDSDCDTPTIYNDQQMDYRKSRSTLDLTLRAGLYRDLELRFNVPYVFSFRRGLRYSDDPRGEGRPGPEFSSVDPSDERIESHAADVFSATDSNSQFVSNLDQFEMHRFMELGDETSSRSRSGFGDPSVGIHWSPWNDQRDDTKATLLLGMDYTMPLATEQRHDNLSVGRGVHELNFKVAASKRFDWIEPYFGVEYLLPIASTDSLFGEIDTGSQGQVLTNPPHEGRFTIGTEFIPYEDMASGARYSLDLRFQFGYRSEGRDYTPLFDHMTDPDNPCNGVTLQDVRPEFDGDGNLVNANDVQCAWVVQQPSNFQGAADNYDLTELVNAGDDTPFAFTDLMSVDSHGVFSGRFGFHLQPVELFRFSGVLGLTRHQSHLISNARTGRAVEGPDVDMDNRVERNPAYNPAYDNPGDRFQVQSSNLWHFMATAALQF